MQCDVCEKNDATHQRVVLSTSPQRILDVCLPCALILDGEDDIDTIEGMDMSEENNDAM